MLRIRLRRVGRKHDPSYQLIVAEKGRGPQTGDYVEKVGTYDARSDEYDLKDERISYWISEGAQPTDTVHNLLAKADIIDDDTVNPLPQKSPITKDTDEEDEDQSETNTEEGEESSSDKDVESSEKGKDDVPQDNEEEDGEQEVENDDGDDDGGEDEEADDDDQE